LVRLIRQISLSWRTLVDMMSMLRVLQKTRLPAPIIAIFGMTFPFLFFRLHPVVEGRKVCAGGLGR